MALKGKTIYGVSNREYSDGGILFVYKDRAMAEEVCRLNNENTTSPYGTSFFVEEIEIKKDIPKFKIVYRFMYQLRPQWTWATMSYGEESESTEVVWEWEDYEWKNLVECRVSYPDCYYGVSGPGEKPTLKNLSVTGTNLEKVRKVYSEHRAKLIATMDATVPLELQKGTPSPQKRNKPHKAGFSTPPVITSNTEGLAQSTQITFPGKKNEH